MTTHFAQDETYQQLLVDYRRQWAKVRQLISRSTVPQERILVEDGLRDQIHKKLRAAAKELGKTAADVDIDILASEENLSEYGLPEFRLMKPFEQLDHPISLQISNLDPLRVARLPIDADQLVKDSDSLEIFLPFGEEHAWHLYDHDQLFSRDRDNLERRRRMHHAAQALGESAKSVEFETLETFHRGERFFGITCSADNLPLVLNRLMIIRKEISIDPRTFDSEQLDHDEQLILRDDLDAIFSHELDEQESYYDLISLYFRSLQATDDEQRVEMLRPIKERSLDDAVYRDKLREARIEHAQTAWREEQIPDRYQKYLDSPKQNPFSRSARR